MPEVVEIMATNRVKDQLFLSEHHIYGSSRLGLKKYGGEEEGKYNYYDQALANGVFGYLGAGQKHWWWPSTSALIGPVIGGMTQALNYNLANQNGPYPQPHHRSAALRAERSPGQRTGHCAGPQDG